MPTTPSTTRDRFTSFGSVAFAVCLAGCAFSSPAAAQSLAISWAGTRVTIVAEAVPLASVLTELARTTGSSVVGLEKATEPVTVHIEDATLHHALRTLLAEKNYIYIERTTAGGLDGVKLWLYRTSPAMAGAKPCVTGACDTDAPDVVTFDAASAAGPTTDPFPRGPSPAEAETARLHANGAFNPDAPEGSLLGLARSADPNVRIRALQTLALQNSRSGFEAINAALTDDHPFVRAEAVDLSLSLGGPAAVTARQLGTLAAHRDPAIRASAALALGDESGEDAEVLLRRLLDDEDASVRNVAAQQLREKESQNTKQQQRKR